MAVILIIDDSPTELHLFQGMIEKGGFETLVADSGEDGIRQAGAARPDCILMDVVMPGMNGFQATRKLTQDPRTSDIPVIMITTKDQETDKFGACDDCDSSVYLQTIRVGFAAKTNRGRIYFAKRCFAGQSTRYGIQ
jgi:twitching motility two-component system response regulator PilH